MSKQRRSKPLWDGKTDALHPYAPIPLSRLEKDAMHEMRIKLGHQQNVIASLQRQMRDLSRIVKLLQTVEVLKPVEQSKSVAGILRGGPR